ncbi:hypothetical protein EVAR_51795_1 [Eumeta japonica]|uniref:Uncharacterized protein n=1 Tax=Eumeta variegata TaxID=151549 RepID=A0A4C2A5D4_EUMVA|nr:hypothetical protein EVAR_51795_1 [Eumeta japonica]
MNEPCGEAAVTSRERYAAERSIENEFAFYCRDNPSTSSAVRLSVNISRGAFRSSPGHVPKAGGPPILIQISARGAIPWATTAAARRFDLYTRISNLDETILYLVRTCVGAVRILIRNMIENAKGIMQSKTRTPPSGMRSGFCRSNEKLLLADRPRTAGQMEIWSMLDDLNAITLAVGPLFASGR